MIEKKAKNIPPNYIIFGIVVCIVLLVKLWGVFLVKIPWISDEVGVWQTAEYVIGYGESWKSYVDYSGVVSGFYGVLSSIIYLPIIALCTNAITAYRFCLILNILLLVIASIFAYKILRTILDIPSEVSAYGAVASVALYPVLFHANVIMTETVFTVWVWMITYVFLKIVKQNRINFKNTVVLVFSLSLGYLIHSRCLIVYCIFGAIIFLYKLFNKKWLISPVTFVLSFILIIFLYSIITNKIQNFFWGANNLQNSTENTALRAKFIIFVLIDDIGGVLKTFISLVAAFTIETFGIIVSCIYISIIYLIYIIRHYKYAKNKISTIAFIVSMGCFWGMIFCIAIIEHAPSRSKWYVYTRYATPFLGQYILICLYLLFKLKYSRKKLILFNCIFVSIIIKWMAINWPILLADAKLGLFDSAFFFCYKLVSIVNKFRINIWVKSVGLLIVGGLSLVLVLIIKKKIKQCSIAIAGFSVILYIISSFSYVTPMQFSNNYWQRVDGLIKCFKKFSLEDYDIQYMGTANFYLPLQISFSQKNAICVVKFEEIQGDNMVYLSDLLINEEISEFIFQLDQDEYLYTSNQELCDLLNNEYVRIK